MSQTEKIIQYMKDHGEITPREAVIYLGCYRLAARIHDARRKGFAIHTDNSKGFARYSLC